MLEKNARIAAEVLAALPKRERHALVRFYVHAEPGDAVCRQAGLTEEQFRRIKARAKASFLALARS
jgi:hypothetical protein